MPCEGQKNPSSLEGRGGVVSASRICPLPRRRSHPGKGRRPGLSAALRGRITVAGQRRIPTGFALGPSRGTSATGLFDCGPMLPEHYFFVNRWRGPRFSCSVVAGTKP